MTNPPTDKSTALEVLARRRLELTARREDLDATIAEVDAALMTLLEPGQSATIDGAPVWTLRHGNRRFNADKAREVLPETLIDAITVTETRLDSKVAKDVLPPALYVMACTEGKPFVAKAGR